MERSGLQFPVRGTKKNGIALITIYPHSSEKIRDQITWQRPKLDDRRAFRNQWRMGEWADLYLEIFYDVRTICLYFIPLVGQITAFWPAYSYFMMSRKPALIAGTIPGEHKTWSFTSILIWKFLTANSDLRRFWDSEARYR